MKSPLTLKKQAAKNLQKHLEEYLQRPTTNVTEFAETLAVTRQYVYKLQSDPDINPSLEIICKLSSILGIKPGDLIS
jgi:DNA-binding Xre family transcriptional regulator